MPKYSGQSVCVVDNGLMCWLAVTLAKDFGKVWYCKPSMGEAFPKSNEIRVGKGLPGVTLCEDYHEILDEVDTWVFPDVYFAGLQSHLQSLGKNVWGSRYG